MSGEAKCHNCGASLDAENDVEVRQPPQQPEPSYHCRMCGSENIEIISMD